MTATALWCLAAILTLYTLKGWQLFAVDCLLNLSRFRTVDDYDGEEMCCVYVALPSIVVFIVVFVLFAVILCVVAKGIEWMSPPYHS